MSAHAIFADKPLSDEHKTELKRIGIMISLWTNAYRSKEGLDQQTERLGGEPRRASWRIPFVHISLLALQRSKLQSHTLSNHRRLED